MYNFFWFGLDVNSFIFRQHILIFSFFFFNDTATTEIYTLSLHDALPIFILDRFPSIRTRFVNMANAGGHTGPTRRRSRYRRLEHAMSVQSFVVSSLFRGQPGLPICFGHPTDSVDQAEARNNDAGFRNRPNTMHLNYDGKRMPVTN